VNQRVKLRNGCAGSNLADLGRDAVHDPCLSGVDSEAGCVCRSGGHGEGLRRSRGEAAGVELGTSLADRDEVNVGTIRGRPMLGIQSVRKGRSVADLGPCDGAEAP
jgi:hypothetical protein